MLKNRNLLIIALIAVVNAVGYGVIIPILYSYSKKFGLSDFANGTLFALFSLCQFLATPVIGRLSDQHGRKPLLLISLAGTAASFFIMAFAPNAIWLFLARALDGITAGNIPVASAVISDSTTAADRAKGFGIIAASFGFGFIAGPSISALTVGISDKLPFLISGGISILAVLLTWGFLPETNQHIGQAEHKKLFDFKKLITILEDKNIAPALLITLFFSIAFGMFIYGFQPFSVKVLHLNPKNIAIVFTAFGVMGLLNQLLILPRFSKLLGPKKAYSIATIMSAVGFSGLFLAKNFTSYLVAGMTISLFNNMVGPLTQAILSQQTDAKSQGTIMGINSSYMSIGTILGPIIGGLLATWYIPLPFLAGALSMLVCFYLSFKVLHQAPKTSAF